MTERYWDRDVDRDTNELEIEIGIDGESGAVYRFSSFPLEIGRDPSCHRSVCHDAVARHLCTVWLEPGGTLRLEERPNLTNPILVEGEPVSGGISKDCLEISVGPVAMRLSVWNSSDPLPEKKKRQQIAAKKSFWAKVLVGLFVGGVALLGAVDLFETLNETSSFVRGDFPGELQFEMEPREGNNPQKAAFLKRVATEYYFRIPIRIPNKHRAIELMMGAAAIEKAAGIPNEQTTQKINSWKRALNQAYRLEVISFFSAQKNNDLHHAASSARKLRRYLEHQSPKLARRLSTLVQEVADQ